MYLSCTCDTNELYKRCTFSCSVSQLSPWRPFFAHNELNIPKNDKIIISDLKKKKW